jgi:hypothetical protein
VLVEGGELVRRRARTLACDLRGDAVEDRRGAQVGSCELAEVADQPEQVLSGTLARRVSVELRPVE